MSSPGHQDYPSVITPRYHVEPVPRRVRAMLGAVTVLDATSAASYVWEAPSYPAYYVPIADVRPDLLVPEGRTQHSPLGRVEVHGLRLGDISRSGAAKLVTDSTAGLTNTVRFDWSSLDAWFEEDEQVFVHPRNPYVRVDALRSTRRVRVELDGAVLADSSSPVMVFETGLPTRYYLNRTDVDFHHLVATETVTACPYKGTTTGYWSVRVGDKLHPDLAWAYDYPTRQLLPIAGLVAFYNERVDIELDGHRLERPSTAFFRSAE